MYMYVVMLYETCKLCGFACRFLIHSNSISVLSFKYDETKKLTCHSDMGHSDIAFWRI